ncbi:MAG: hypothetical protein IPG96_11135 [Proteobacteria bacterium]|nr:hypothetical protein [Pseudomonadota bacterium]
MSCSPRHRLHAATRLATRLAGPALAALLLAAPIPAAAGPLAAALATSSAGAGRVVAMRARLAEATGARIAQLRTLRARFVERAHAATERMGFARRLTPALVERSTSALQRLRQERGAPTLRGLFGATLAVRRLTRALHSSAGQEVAAHQSTPIAKPLRPLVRLMVRAEAKGTGLAARAARALLLRPAAHRLFRLPVLREVAEQTVRRELQVAERWAARIARQGNADPAALERAGAAVEAARALLHTIGGRHPAPLAASRSSAGADYDDEQGQPYARPRAQPAGPAQTRPAGRRVLLTGGRTFSRAAMEAFGRQTNSGRATPPTADTRSASFATSNSAGRASEADESVGVL